MNRRAMITLCGELKGELLYLEMIDIDGEDEKG